jgi:serine/threonine-protein kinase
MNASSTPNYRVPEDQARAQSDSETGVWLRTSTEQNVPPSAPTRDTAPDLIFTESEEQEGEGDDAVLLDVDLEGERATLPHLESPELPPSSFSPSEDLTGELIDGRYQVDCVLGVGAMGIVYGARHVAVGKLVAIKALRAHLARDASAIQRFNAEATAATSIGNQHIVETFDFGRLPDGTAYMVMEYLEGRSLAELIDGWAPLPVERIARIGLQIAEALNAAHLAGIVHRDLKPDNVFLCKREGDSDFVKILDFGIAKFGMSQARLTQAGAVFGTPVYMSPEQALGKATDGRTDVYALGIMLYEMASGGVPFRGESALTVLALHLTEQPEPLSARQPDISPELEAIVHKCLQKDPDARYASMAELAADLSLLASGKPVCAKPLLSAPVPLPPAAKKVVTLPEIEPTLPAPAGARPLGRGVPWPLVLLMLLAVVSGACWFSQHRAPSLARPSTPQVQAKPSPPPLPATAKVADDAPEREVALVLFPLDARVFLGDVDLGPMPVSVKVKEGDSVNVRIVRDGYWMRKLTLDGSKKRVVVGLVKRSGSKTTG